jgi:hypothetical protein
MKCGIVFGAVAVLIVSAGTASAEARLEGVKGPVSVNSGDGFQPALGPVALQPGDKVMADRGGNAVIAYGNNCNISVKPGSVVAVAATPPCLKTSANLQQGSSQGLNGEGGGIGMGMMGIVPVAGIVGAGAALGGKNKSGPSDSP